MEEKRRADPDGDGGVAIDVRRDVEDVRDLGGAVVKTAGVLGPILVLGPLVMDSQ